MYIKNNFLKILKKNFNSKIINIYSDNPLNTSYFKDISNQNVLNSIPVFDYFFIFSKKILKKISLKLKCDNIFYLPFANDPKLHKKKTSKCQTKYDISFVGTADRERFLLINNLKKYKIILAGDGWKQYKLNNNVNYIGNIQEKKFAKVICESYVSLNIFRKQNEGSHNMKTFEIPAMGGLMITKRSKEQNFFFPENKACIMYKNVDELLKKIEVIVKNPNKFNHIKKRGYYYSKNNTYKKRAIYILNTIFKNEKNI